MTADRFYRIVRYAVQAQQGGGFFELQIVGECRFRNRLCVQYAPLRPYEVVRIADGVDHRHYRVYHRRATAQAQAATAQSDCRGSEGRPGRSESTRGDR